MEYAWNTQETDFQACFQMLFFLLTSDYDVSPYQCITALPLLVRHAHIRIRLHISMLRGRRWHRARHLRSTVLEVMLGMHTVRRSGMSLGLRRLLLLLLLLIQIGCLLVERCMRLRCRLCHRVVHHRVRRQSTGKTTGDWCVKIERMLLNRKIAVCQCILTTHPTVGVEF